MKGLRCKGQHYEVLAKKYLGQQGLTLIQQNYHSRFGEIDLIMSDAGVLCFIEVKFRKSLHFGGAIAAIPASKQQRIIKTAQFFITENRQLAHHPMRFDAVIIQQLTNSSELDINWVQSAFYAE